MRALTGLLAAAAFAQSLASQTVVVAGDDADSFVSFLQRFPIRVERWSWDDLGKRPLKGFDAVYLLADPRSSPARVLSREAAWSLVEHVRGGGGYYIEGVRPGPYVAAQMLGFLEKPGIVPVGILKAIKSTGGNWQSNPFDDDPAGTGVAGKQAAPAVVRHWISEGFDDRQLWQVRATSFIDGQPLTRDDQVLLELAPAAGTYRIYAMARGSRHPALIAPQASNGRGFYAPLPLSSYARNQFGPKQAWERLMERVVLAPYSAAARDRLLRDRLAVEAWTEPRTWAPPDGATANVQLVVECPQDAELEVPGVAATGWAKQPDGRRVARLALGPGEHNIRVQVRRAGRTAVASVPFTVAERSAWYRNAVARNLRWFAKSGVLPAPDGSRGILEGFDSVEYDLLPSVRSDCLMQAALLFAIYGRQFAEPQWTETANKLFRFGFANGFQDDNRAHPTFGFWKFFENVQDYPLAIYTDDNGWAAYANLRAYQLNGDKEHLRRGLATVDGFLETQTPGGLRMRRMEGPDLLKNGRAWYARTGKPSNNPHYVSTGDRAVLEAYAVTKDAKYLASARRAIDAMAAAYPDFEMSGTITRATHVAKFLASPVLMYHHTREEKYLELARRVTKDLRGRQHATGAIPEWGAHKREYYATEGAVITEEGEPISDQLYTTNFALLNLQQACDLLNEREACDAFTRLADYITRIQVRSADPRLDGAWQRSFDFERWETYGNNSDIYWGPYCIETGWINTIISMALLDHLGGQSAGAGL